MRVWWLSASWMVGPLNTLMEMENIMLEYCVWPNGDWCEPEELNEWLLDHSDDFELVTVFDEEELDDAIERVVNRRTPLDAFRE